MTGLGTRDLENALEFAHYAQATEDLEAFRHELVPAMRQLVACETLGYNEIDLHHRTAAAITDAPLIDGWEERFLALADQHPLLVAQKRGDLRPALLSDHLSERQFHRLELYQDIYRLIEVEDQIAFGLPGEMIVAIVLTRRQRSFTERDRRMIELMRPPMTLAYRRALERERERERERELIRALGAGLGERDAALIQLDARGRAVYATAAAAELLEAYLGELPRDRHVLPTAIREWLARAQGSPAPPELTLAGARGRLRLRLRQRGARDEWRVLSLQEHRRRPPAIEALRALGLTERQAQVLRLLACGKTSRQVAAELQISAATVEKHTEHLYEILGVSNRAEALAHAYA